MVSWAIRLTRNRRGQGEPSLPEKRRSQPPAEDSLCKARAAWSKLHCLKSNPGWSRSPPTTRHPPDGSGTALSRTLANVVTLDGEGRSTAWNRFARANTVARECDIGQRVRA